MIQHSKAAVFSLCLSAALAAGCDVPDLTPLNRDASSSNSGGSANSGGSSNSGGSANSGGSSGEPGPGGSSNPAGTGGSAGIAASSGGSAGSSGMINDASLLETGAPQDAAVDQAVVGSNLTKDSVFDAADLVAWYRFIDANLPGTDSGKHGNNSFIGHDVAPTIDPARGYAGVFNGSAEQFFPTSVRDSFTFTFWIKTSTPGMGTAGGPWYEGTALLDGEAGGVTTDYGVALIGSNIVVGVGSPDTTFVTTKTITDGAWHHVGITRDTTSGDVIVYFDGTLDSQKTMSAGTRTAASMNLSMGTRGLNASISDLRFYGRVLSAADVMKVSQGM